MSARELKPCPFCGGRARLVTAQVAEDSMCAYASCTKCGVQSEVFEDAYAPIYDAVAAWNHRADLPAGYAILSPDEVRGIRDEALEEAAETVRKMIPVIPHDGPSTPMQEIEYTSLGFAMTAIRSMKGGRDAQ